MNLRWCLPPLAVLSLAGLLWITFHGGEVAPEELLASARAQLEDEPQERAGPLRALDEALRQARAPEQADLRAELLDLRSALYEEEGLLELALADCRARLDEWGASTDTLARAGELCLELSEPGLALEYAEHLASLDPARGQGQIGRARVALADLPLAALERQARATLLPSLASQATTLAQRAAVFAADEQASSVTLEELLELFPRADERRRAGEWVHEAAEHLGAARRAFVASLAPETNSDAVSGLQDLLLRGGAEREAADLGTVALSNPALAQPMPVLARTASALVALGRDGAARGLILDLERRDKEALVPEDLPSLALRDELEEWCRLLETLELWKELREAAEVFCERAEDHDSAEKAELAHWLAAMAELRRNNLPGAQHHLDAIGTTPLGGRERAVSVWLTRAELARRKGERSQERYALLAVTRSAPLDPPLELRPDVGRAWERLSELQKDEGNPDAAEVSLTHALRLAGKRAAEVEALWHEMGRKALATRGASSPYLLYTRAKNQDGVGEAALALTDARALLENYPGLGPALEVVSSAAEKQRDYPLMIGASLELMERGWSSAAVSARLRSVPREYFLPQDRVRWLLLDPRGSLGDVVRVLLAKGQKESAARAARTGSSPSQPPELLPLLARILLESGEATIANELLDSLPADGALFRSCTGLVLTAALQRPQPKQAQQRQAQQRQEETGPGAAEPAQPKTKASKAAPVDLAAVVEKVLASGRAEDPELPQALDGLLVSGRASEVESLLAWLAPQSPPFLGETLLRQSVARTVARNSAAVDEDLERAAALLDDGRPEFGRLVVAFELGDEEAFAREARAVLATPLARAPGRSAALALLAGDPETAARSLAGLVADGREPLQELVQACLASRATDSAESGIARLPAALLAVVPEKQLLLLALAAEIAPWNVWVLARLDALDAPEATEAPEADESPDAPARSKRFATLGRTDPWLRAFRAQSMLTLGWFSKTLGAARAEGEPNARLAWLRVRAERALALAPEDVRAAEIDWLVASGSSAATRPELAPLEAARAVRDGKPEEAQHLLQSALEQRPGDPELLLALGELENTSGRRTRAIELLGLALAKLAPGEGDAQVPLLLEVLRAARDEGEISEERWWAEVEALEAERPADPAPARELAARALERTEPGTATGRTQALERLGRLRARTLDRPLETLRIGEGERWIELLAEYTPERAVAFAEEELRRAPSDPALWRASATALLAARRPSTALERLTALQKVAPETETARLVALTSFQIENDAENFLERLETMKRSDSRVKDDAVLAFYERLLGTQASKKADKKDKKDSTQEGAGEDETETRDIEGALELWRARAGNGLATSEHGRALALELFYEGRRAGALKTLDETAELARSALEKDMLSALAQLMRSAPAAPRRPREAGPAEAYDAPDEPAKSGKAGGPGKKSAAAPAGKGAPKSKEGGAPTAPKARSSSEGAPAAPKGKAGGAQGGPKAKPGGTQSTPKAKGEKAE